MVLKNQFILAPRVIVCAGYETTGLLENLGINLNIIPNRGVVLVSEKVPFKLNKKLMGANFGNSKKNNVSLCIEQSLEGNLLIGSSHELGVVSRIVSPQLISNIASNALSVYPSIKDISIIRVFTGIRPHCEEGPFFRQIEGYKGLYVASGHGGMGITLAPWAGYSMAEMIVN